MESLKLLFTLLLATMAIVSASSSDTNNIYDDDDFKLSNIKEVASLRGLGRVLAQRNLPANYTCNKFPRVCWLKGSAGPDCCKKNCVNVKKDQLNCGMCGYKCKYTEMCCGGKCVDATYDKRHCGGCYNKCKKGHFCAYGMCDFA